MVTRYAPGQRSTKANSPEACTEVAAKSAKLIFWANQLSAFVLSKAFARNFNPFGD
jgi:hypothetical protein